jgi:hypothetical protein
MRPRSPLTSSREMGNRGEGTAPAAPSGLAQIYAVASASIAAASESMAI